jgi:hypothetical protein
LCGDARLNVLVSLSTAAFRLGSVASRCT